VVSALIRRDHPRYSFLCGTTPDGYCNHREFRIVLVGPNKSLKQRVTSVFNSPTSATSDRPLYTILAGVPCAADASRMYPRITEERCIAEGETGVSLWDPVIQIVHWLCSISSSNTSSCPAEYFQRLQRTDPDERELTIRVTGHCRPVFSSSGSSSGLGDVSCEWSRR
jgi:hypothetical protein